MATNEFEAYYDHTARESTISNIIIRSRDPWPAAAGSNYSTHIVADSRRLGPGRRLQLHAQPEQQLPYDAAAASTPACTCNRCHPALLIGNAFSKLVHVVTNLPEEATPLCVSNEASPSINESLMVTPQFVPHYSIYTNELDAPRAPALARLKVESANAASNCSSSSLVHEAAQTATTSSEEVNPGGANDYTINIVTLHNIWRLTRCPAADSGDRDSTGLDENDLFIIPTEESLIGQQSSLHELVIGN